MMKRRKRKVLVTGASGFLGPHICEAAHDAGYEVHALIRETSSRQWLKHDWLSIHVTDVTDRQALASILGDVDYVIHCVRVKGRNERDLRRINTELIRMLVDESVKAGIERFVYSSSLSAGGPGRTPHARTEDDPDVPVTYYGRRKKAAEEMLCAALKKLHVICLRYSLIYGPRDPHTFTMFKAMQAGYVPAIGCRPSYGSMVYVCDAAQAAVCALAADVASGSIYQITDGHCFRFDKFYDYLAQALGMEGKWKRIRIPFWLAMAGSWGLHRVFKSPEIYPDRVRQFKAPYWCASCEKAMAELGFKPQVALREGLAITAKWYRNQGWLSSPHKVTA